MDRKEIPKKTRDEDYLREAIQAAQATRMNGNHPFGAVLAGKKSRLLLKA